MAECHKDYSPGQSEASPWAMFFSPFRALEIIYSKQKYRKVMLIRLLQSI